MQASIEHRCHCPYCGEPLSLLIDRSAGSQTYVEDCSVCCQPIVVQVSDLGEDYQCTVEAENA